MRGSILKTIVFILLLLLHAWLSVWLGVPFGLWFKVQMLNIGLFSIVWGIMFWLIKSNPNYVGIAFMLVLMLMIVLFKVLVERVLNGVVLSSKQRLIVISSFGVYLIFTVALLVQVLKNIRFNEKKD